MEKSKLAEGSEDGIIRTSHGNPVHQCSRRRHLPALYHVQITSCPRMSIWIWIDIACHDRKWFCPVVRSRMFDGLGRLQVGRLLFPSQW